MLAKSRPYFLVCLAYIIYKHTNTNTHSSSESNQPEIESSYSL